MYVWQEFITDDEGNLLNNAFLEVRNADGLELATIYADRQGITELDNPFRSRKGFARFWAPAGRYQITAIEETDERVWADVRLGFTLADLPDLTSLVQPIVNAILDPAIAEATAIVEAKPNLQFFTVESDGSSSNLPDGWSSQRIGTGRYRVTHRGATLEYLVKLTVWDLSSDRVASAMMIELAENDFTYQVRSIHDEASDTDARVEVEVTGDVAPPPFPYTFVAVRSDGRWNHSQDGITWTDGGFIEGSSQARDWNRGCFVEPLNRVYVAAAGNRVAYLDGATATWTHFVATAPSNTGFENIIWTPLFGGANGRLYINYRQSGGTRGGLLYSDDGGTTWTEVTYSGGKPATNFDMEYMFHAPNTVVIGGRAGTDSNSQKHFYTTTDGTTFAASLGPVSFDIQIGDGFTRDAAYSPAHDLIFVFGTSQSNFTQPRIMTLNATATAVVGSLVNAPTNNNADNFCAIATPTAVLGGFSGGVSNNGNSVVRKIGGAAFAGNLAGIGLQPMQFAYSPTLGRIVAAMSASAFQYSDDDGTTWTQATAQGSTTSWRAVVASS